MEVQRGPVYRASQAAGHSESFETLRELAQRRTSGMVELGGYVVGDPLAPEHDLEQRRVLGRETPEHQRAGLDEILQRVGDRQGGDLFSEEVEPVGCERRGQALLGAEEAVDGAGRGAGLVGETTD